MFYATTFSGIGGWELGLDAAGWKLLWQCERDPAKRAFLRDRFGVPVFRSIEDIGRATPPRIDVLAASPPCQPFSLTGKRKGTSDDRHLWPLHAAVIQRLTPRYCLVEQVDAIDGVVLDQMLSDLEALGYEVLPALEIPACAVGAWHERSRIFLIAHNARVHRLPHDRVVPGRKRRPSEQFRRPACASMAVGWEPTHKWFEREPPLGRLVHGIPDSVDMLHGLGDSVVPQIPFLIAQAINQIEEGN